MKTILIIMCLMLAAVFIVLEMYRWYRKGYEEGFDAGYDDAVKEMMEKVK